MEGAGTVAGARGTAAGDGGGGRGRRPEWRSQAQVEGGQPSVGGRWWVHPAEAGGRRRGRRGRRAAVAPAGGGRVAVRGRRATGSGG
ncbi:hypothetical protein GUJ93_ZPchr0009g2039 [Zizania palustris]|uniref:Uncharacterized protein n=1 Tax=Zizania palustris TaxID=103762 RepID=A0A8J5VKN3_ZIZPA|nr:hypothetical protein GUJ93_ZPchr0009g2039 [Zizania palustris]